MNIVLFVITIINLIVLIILANSFIKFINSLANIEYHVSDTKHKIEGIEQVIFDNKRNNINDSKITDILILCKKAKNSFKNLSTDISTINKQLNQIKPKTALKNDFRSVDDEQDLDAYNL